MRLAGRAVAAGLLIFVMSGAGVRADVPAEDGQLRLIVRHALDVGRLVVRVGETAIFSAPLASLRAASAGDVERLLSIPSGLQTVSVELRNGSGRIVARQQVRGLVVPGTAAVLDVIASGAGDLLQVDWRRMP